MSASPTETTPAIIEPEQYREVMGHYPTGVAVITGRGSDGAPIGMVVGTFTAVSLDPPLVAFMPTTTSGTFALMKDSPAFCINVLAHDQLELCRTMAVPRADKFDEVDWTMSAHGAPMLAEAVAHVHCSTQSVVQAGDHLIVLCAVHDMSVTRPVTPLLFFQGGYGGFNPRGMSATGDADIIAAARLAEVARPQVDKIARTLACEAAVLVAINEHELTTAITAWGGAAEMVTPLGDRVPLVPPLGEAYIAFRADDELESWLARTASRDPEVNQRYRRRIATVREHGYAVSRMSAESGPDYQDLKGALREYAGGGLTPARERAVRSVIASASAFFETFEIEADGRYDLGAIVVPVLGPDGTATMCLRAGQLPAQALGSQVLEWIEFLTREAAVVARRLNANDQHSAMHYLNDAPGNVMM